MTIQEQLAQVQQQLVDEKAKGADRNPDTISALEKQEAVLLTQTEIENVQKQLTDAQNEVPPNQSKIDLLNMRMSDLKEQINPVEIAHQHEERVQQATIEINDLIDNLTVDGLTLRDLCAGEIEAQLLKIRITQLYQAQAKKLSKQIQGIQEQSAENLRASGERERNLQFQNEQLQKGISEAKADADQYKRDRDDFEQKLQAATTELEGQKLLVAEKQQTIDDLRQQVANAPAPKVAIDITEQTKALADQIKKNRIRVTNMQPTDYTNKTIRATLAQDLPEEGKHFGDVIEFPSVYKGKYLEVSADEAERFHAEQSAQNPVHDQPLDQQSVTPPTLPVAPLPTVEDKSATFQTQNDASGVDGVQPQTNSGDHREAQPDAGAVEQVTRAEHEALKAQVDALGQKVADLYAHANLPLSA